MNITIIGAGALGNMLATKFSENNNVTLVVKDENEYLIRNQQIIFKKINGEYVKPKIEITNTIKESDVIILCIKSYDIGNIIERIKPMKSPIMCCQNGLQTLNLIMKEINTERLSYLVTGHGISKIKPGISEHKGKGFTYIGELSGKNSKRMKNICNELKLSGLECNIVKNIEEYVWLKTIINSAINPVATLAEVRNGELKRPNLNDDVMNLCKESKNIAERNGIVLPLDPWKEINYIIEKTSENKCSMLQDLENGRKTEIDAINGEIIRIARKLSIIPTYNMQVVSEIERLSVNT